MTPGLRRFSHSPRKIGTGFGCTFVGCTTTKKMMPTIAASTVTEREPNCQPKWSLTVAEIMRLDSPPSVLPVMKLPTAAPSARGDTDSAKRVTAMAGTPAMAMPSSRRRATSAPKLLASGKMTLAASEAIIAMRIVCMRPMRSESIAHGSTPSATPMVAAPMTHDTVSAATPNERAISGSMPCGAYICPKAANPAQNMAMTARR